MRQCTDTRPSYNSKNIAKGVFNNRGSTLLMLLMVISILTMLGTVVLSVAVSNYKMKAVNSKVKTNLYLAESGIEEAYGLLGQLVDEAISEGREAADEWLELIDIEGEKEKWRDSLSLTSIDEYGNIVIGPIYTSRYINEVGSINMDVIQSEQEEKFIDAYKNYLIGGDVEPNRIYSRLNNSSNYSFLFDTNKPEISIDGIPTFNNDGCDVKLISTFEHEGIEKTVTVTYEVLVPDYNEPYYTTTKVEKIKENPIWDKAIAITGDLKVNNKRFLINGDVFAEGSNNRFGGISILSDQSTLDVKGNVASKNNLIIGSSNSNVLVNGNIFAKNVAINYTKTNGVRLFGSNIKVSKENNEAKVYTLDDLELSGESSEIYIGGSYYGLSDGSNYSQPDNSSSILINTLDIGNGSKLTIKDEALIPGTSYISTNIEKYQTGESISVKGNYKAYTYPLINSEDAISGGKSLKEDNVIFRYLDPLTLVSDFRGGVELNALDKSIYFKSYYNEYVDEHDLILGPNNGININNAENNSKVKHLGALVYNNKIKSSNYQIGFQAELEERNLEYNRGVYFGKDDSTNIEGNIINNFVDFSKIDYKNSYEETSNQIGSSREILLLDKSSNEYAIIGKDADESLLPSNENIKRIYLGNENFLKGVIITGGNIHILGEVNFKGMIISKGNLSSLGDKLISIYYDKEYVAKTILENGTHLNDVFINGSSEDYNVETQEDIGSGENVTQVIKDKLINMKNWSVIR